MNRSSSNHRAWKVRTHSGPKYPALLRAKKYYSRQDRLTQAQQDLALEFLPLARGLCKPLKHLFPCWRDEFESASTMALVEAARTFNPRRKIRFATFARFRIRGALMDVGRRMVLAGWEPDEEAPALVSLNTYSEEHGKVLLAFEPPPVGTDVDDLDEVEFWLRKLPKRHATVCRLYYLCGKSQMEIAHAMGCSQSEVTRLHRKSLDLLSEPYPHRATTEPDGDEQPTDGDC